MVVLRNAHVVDVSLGIVRPPQDVHIEGRSIASLCEAQRNVGDGEGELDCSGKYLIPGLFDCHAHLAYLTTQDADSMKRDLADFVRRGVLYARDVGGPIDVLRTMRDRIAGGELRGPRIFYAGPMLESSPLHWEEHNRELPGFTVAIDSEEDARRLLPELAAQGARMIKTFNKIALPLYRQLLEVARDCSLKVVHDPGAPLFNWVPIDRAVELGATSIEHAKSPWPFVLRDDLRERHNAVAVPGADRAEQMRVMLMAARAGLDGVSVERLHALADLMLEHGAVLCPTLGVFAATETTSAEDDGETGAAQTEDPNAEVRRMIVAAVELLSNFFVEVLAADGVRMLLGSDSRSAAASIEEARHMRKAGVSEIEVLRAATLYPAEWLGIDDRHGSIGPGAAADVVVLHGNPLEDIGNLEAVEAVVQNGVLVSQ